MLCYGGIEESELLSAIQLYPNPNSGTLTLETRHLGDSEYLIYDMLGKVIAHQSITADRQQIQLPDIAAGVYTLSVRTAAGSRQLRFTVE